MSRHTSTPVSSLKESSSEVVDLRRIIFPKSSNRLAVAGVEVRTKTKFEGRFTMNPDRSDPFRPRPSHDDISSWWNNVLRSPRHVVAPMVDASELPWRMLSRRYASDLCYTPMIHSKNFVRDVTYRNECLNACKCLEDRPLIVQFCGNDPQVIADAAKYVKGYCDGIDINLGCPQKIAKNGRYGAYLQNEWELIASLVQSINNVGIPVSCKIRRFDDIERTVQYAKMIEAAGCWMLTVHGRTINQKGNMTGLADWSYIKAVKDAVSIPVIANGNIQYLNDVERCIDATGVNGVMSAEGSLHNPAIFSGLQPFVWEMAAEYLELVKTYPCPISYVRGHLFKIFHHLLVLEPNFDLRDALAKGFTLESFEDVTTKLKQRYEVFAMGVEQWIAPDNHRVSSLPFPPWICQPYERPPPPPADNSQQDQSVTIDNRVPSTKADLPKLSSKKSWKKLAKQNRILMRKPDRNNKRLGQSLCENSDCPNISGSKCVMKLCRRCCKEKCNEDILDCEGHHIFVKNVKPTKIRREDYTEVGVVAN